MDKKLWQNECEKEKNNGEKNAEKNEFSRKLGRYGVNPLDHIDADYNDMFDYGYQYIPPGESYWEFIKDKFSASKCEILEALFDAENNQNENKNNNNICSNQTIQNGSKNDETILSTYDEFDPELIGLLNGSDKHHLNLYVTDLLNNIKKSPFNTDQTTSAPKLQFKQQIPKPQKTTPNLLSKFYPPNPQFDCSDRVQHKDPYEYRPETLIMTSDNDFPELKTNSRDLVCGSVLPTSILLESIHLSEANDFTVEMVPPSPVTYGNLGLPCSGGDQDLIVHESEGEGNEADLASNSTYRSPSISRSSSRRAVGEGSKQKPTGKRFMGLNCCGCGMENIIHLDDKNGKDIFEDGNDDENHQLNARNTRNVQNTDDKNADNSDSENKSKRSKNHTNTYESITTTPEPTPSARIGSPQLDNIVPPHNITPQIIKKPTSNPISSFISPPSLHNSIEESPPNPTHNTNPFLQKVPIYSTLHAFVDPAPAHLSAFWTNPTPPHQAQFYMPGTVAVPHYATGPKVYIRGLQPNALFQTSLIGQKHLNLLKKKMILPFLPQHMVLKMPSYLISDPNQQGTQDVILVDEEKGETFARAKWIEKCQDFAQKIANFDKFEHSLENESQNQTKKCSCSPGDSNCYKSLKSRFSSSILSLPYTTTTTNRPTLSQIAVPRQTTMIPLFNRHARTYGMEQSLLSLSLTGLSNNSSHLPSLSQFYPGRSSFFTPYGIVQASLSEDIHFGMGTFTTPVTQSSDLLPVVGAPHMSSRQNELDSDGEPGGESENEEGSDSDDDVTRPAARGQRPSGAPSSLSVTDEEMRVLQQRFGLEGQQLVLTPQRLEDIRALSRETGLFIPLLTQVYGTPPAHATQSQQRAREVVEQQRETQRRSIQNERNYSHAVAASSPIIPPQSAQSSQQVGNSPSLGPNSPTIARWTGRASESPLDLRSIGLGRQNQGNMTPLSLRPLLPPANASPSLNPTPENTTAVIPLGEFRLSSRNPGIGLSNINQPSTPHTYSAANTFNHPLLSQPPLNISLQNSPANSTPASPIPSPLHSSIGFGSGGSVPINVESISAMLRESDPNIDDEDLELQIALILSRQDQHSPTPDVGLPSQRDENGITTSTTSTTPQTPQTPQTPLEKLFLEHSSTASSLSELSISTHHLDNQNVQVTTTRYPLGQALGSLSYGVPYHGRSASPLNPHPTLSERAHIKSQYADTLRISLVLTPVLIKYLNELSQAEKEAQNKEIFAKKIQKSLGPFYYHSMMYSPSNNDNTLDDIDESFVMNPNIGLDEIDNDCDGINKNENKHDEHQNDQNVNSQNTPPSPPNPSSLSNQDHAILAYYGVTPQSTMLSPKIPFSGIPTQRALPLQSYESLPQITILQPADIRPGVQIRIASGTRRFLTAAVCSEVYLNRNLFKQPIQYQNCNNQDNNSIHDYTPVSKVLHPQTGQFGLTVNTNAGHSVHLASSSLTPQFQQNFEYLISQVGVIIAVSSNGLGFGIYPDDPEDSSVDVNDEEDPVLYESYQNWVKKNDFLKHSMNIQDNNAIPGPSSCLVEFNDPLLGISSRMWLSSSSLCRISAMFYDKYPEDIRGVSLNKTNAVLQNYVGQAQEGIKYRVDPITMKADISEFDDEKIVQKGKIKLTNAELLTTITTTCFDQLYHEYNKAYIAAYHHLIRQVNYLLVPHLTALISLLPSLENNTIAEVVNKMPQILNNGNINTDQNSGGEDPTIGQRNDPQINPNQINNNSIHHVLSLQIDLIYSHRISPAFLPGIYTRHGYITTNRDKFGHFVQNSHNKDTNNHLSPNKTTPQRPHFNTILTVPESLRVITSTLNLNPILSKNSFYSENRIKNFTNFVPYHNNKKIAMIRHVVNFFGKSKTTSSWSILLLIISYQKMFPNLPDLISISLSDIEDYIVSNSTSSGSAYFVRNNAQSRQNRQNRQNPDRSISHRKKYDDTIAKSVHNALPMYLELLDQHKDDLDPDERIVLEQFITNLIKIEQNGAKNNKFETTLQNSSQFLDITSNDDDCKELDNNYGDIIYDVPTLPTSDYLDQLVQTFGLKFISDYFTSNHSQLPPTQQILLNEDDKSPIVSLFYQSDANKRRNKQILSPTVSTSNTLCDFDIINPLHHLPQEYVSFYTDLLTAVRENKQYPYNPVHDSNQLFKNIINILMNFGNHNSTSNPSHNLSAPQPTIDLSELTPPITFPTRPSYITYRNILTALPLLIHQFNQDTTQFGLLPPPTPFHFNHIQHIPTPIYLTPIAKSQSYHTSPTLPRVFTAHTAQSASNIYTPAHTISLHNTPADTYFSEKDIHSNGLGYSSGTMTASSVPMYQTCIEGDGNNGLLWLSRLMH
jgi:hypothetical protein